MGQGHVEQVHRVKGARNELEMVPAVPRPKIAHVHKISAQSEQIRQRYSKINWFLKIACLRYVSSWGWDCVSGVHPCLVHSQKLSELTGHSDGGQNPYRTAVRPINREFRPWQGEEQMWEPFPQLHFGTKGNLHHIGKIWHKKIAHIKVFSPLHTVYYRETIRNGKNLLLTSIWDVPPSCLGSS